MSVQRYEVGKRLGKQKRPTRWRVRWRDPSGKMNSRSFLTFDEASGFDAQVRIAKLRGTAPLQRTKRTLNEAFEEWQALRGRELATATLTTYRALWRRHVAEDLGLMPLSALEANPKLIEEAMSRMLPPGSIAGDSKGSAARRKAIFVVSAVLRAATEWRWINANPLANLRKPSAPPTRSKRPLAPIVIERIRHEVRARRSLDADGVRSLGDACLISVLAYGGLRPQEALALTWADVQGSGITIDKAVADGRVSRTKTGKSRLAPLVEPLAADLREWRKACGDPAGRAFVFPGDGGEPWSATQFRNWRSRVWRPALERLAEGDDALSHLREARPYDLRGSFVSLQLRAGCSPVEVASWSGHAVRVMYEHYAGVIHELIDQPRVPATEEISHARTVLATQPSDEVIEMVAESVRPREEPSQAARALLYGRRGDSGTKAA
jgi:integrase